MVAQFGSLRWVALRAAAVYVPQVFLFAVETMITNKHTADNPHIRRTSITGRYRYRMLELVDAVQARHVTPDISIYYTIVAEP